MPTSDMSLVEALHQRRLVIDGGMGTELMRVGLRSGECAERWNVERPEAVMQVHRDYLDAGATLLITNTFGGSAAALGRHGLGDGVAKLNRAGAALARRVAGERAWVLGDIGPTGAFLEPMGELTAEAAQAMFREQAQALVAGGADGLIVETMTDPNELALAVAAACETGKAVFASFAFDRAGDERFATMMGTSPESAVRSALDAGAAAVGANCGTNLDMDAYARLATALVEAAGDMPVMLQPNAGVPELVDGQPQFALTPEQMGDAAARLLCEGVRLVGGCCGTTPAHIRAVAHAVADHEPGHDR